MEGEPSQNEPMDNYHSDGLTFPLIDAGPVDGLMPTFDVSERGRPTGWPRRILVKDGGHISITLRT